MNVEDRAGASDVRRGRLEYFAGDQVEVSSHVGCRVTQPAVPGLDLAALCLLSPAG